MRTATKSTLGLVSLGLFAASYQIGLTAVTGFTFAEGSAAESTNPSDAASGLVTAAIKASGSNFGNISNATYTTNAFKKAVESALAKF